MEYCYIAISLVLSLTCGGNLKHMLRDIGKQSDFWTQESQKSFAVVFK